MSNKKLQNLSTPKLAQTLDNLEQETAPKGFISQSQNSSLKTKTFTLRTTDIHNLKQISLAVNNQIERKRYPDSQIIRGMINYIAENEKKLAELIPYIKNSP